MDPIDLVSMVNKVALLPRHGDSELGNMVAGGNTQTLTELDRAQSAHFTAESRIQSPQFRLSPKLF